MRIFLGGHLNFYHPQKDKWLEFDIQQPTLLTAILDSAKIPLGEVHLVVINGEVFDLKTAIIQPNDQVKLFSAVGGG